MTSDAAAEPASIAESPGQMIRRVRERAGMSLEDLAGQIKLSRSTLDALERDDFAHLGQPVYVRGYYRKCAKILPLSEQELLAGYEARVAPSAPQALRRIPLAGGVSSGAVPGQQRQLMVAVIAVGVVIGLLYWLARGDSDVRTEVRPALQVDELPISAATDSSTATTPSAETAAPEPAVETPTAVAETAPAVPPNQLALQFIEASWVRVEDSRNKTLLIGLVRAGEKQLLQGEPPYTAFIGNARKVRAEFNGQPFDFARHIQPNDTARFTVP